MIAVADLLAWLGNPSEPGVSTLLTALEARAVEILETETGRHFGASAPLTEYLRGDGATKLRLNENPAAITSVEYRTYVGEAWTAIASGDADGWELRAPPAGSVAGATLLRKAGYRWSTSYEYKVAYSFGYTAGAEPGDIQQAVMEIVAFLYQERGREGLRGETIGDYSYSVMAEATGKRNMLTSSPTLAETITRWKGLVYA